MSDEKTKTDKKPSTEKTKTDNPSTEKKKPEKFTTFCRYGCKVTYTSTKDISIHFRRVLALYSHYKKKHPNYAPFYRCRTQGNSQ